MFRPGYVSEAQLRRDCPKCRYPMLRWETVKRSPERVWVMWQPEQWKVPWHIIIYGALMLVLMSTPLGLGVVGSPGGKLAFYIANALGLGVMTGVGYWNYLTRQQRRKKLQLYLRENDWVCPHCLHAEHAQWELGSEV